MIFIQELVDLFIEKHLIIILHEYYYDIEQLVKCFHNYEIIKRNFTRPYTEQFLHKYDLFYYHPYNKLITYVDSYYNKIYSFSVGNTFNFDKKYKLHDKSISDIASEYNMLNFDLLSLILLFNSGILKLYYIIKIE